MGGTIINYHKRITTGQDERLTGRMTGGRGETRDAWKKKDDKGRERNTTGGKRNPQGHSGRGRGKGNDRDSGRG